MQKLRLFGRLGVTQGHRKHHVTGTWDMAIDSNRQQRGTGAWRGEMSGLNCHTVLRPIDAALDEM